MQFSISKFWQWWKGELLALFPDVWQNQFNKKNIYVLQLEDNMATLNSIDGKNVQSKKYGPDTIDDLKSDIARFANNHRPYRIFAQISDENIFSFPREYPHNAVNVLEALVRTDILKNFPFKLEDVAYSSEVTGVNNSRGRINVKHYVVKKPVLEKLKDRFLLKDINIDGYSFTSDGSAFIKGDNINLWWRDNNRKVASFLAFLIGVFLLYGSFLSYHGRAIDHMEMAVKSLEVEAKDLRLQQEKAKALQIKTNYIRGSVSSSPKFIESWNELAKILPADVRLTTIDYSKDRVSLKGHAEKTETLIGILEGSDLFRNVSFSSSTTTDFKTGLEKFNLQADLMVYSK